MKDVIAGRLVEWDDRKNEINKQKHGISFELAALVFTDEERIEYLDTIHSVEEERYIVLGRVGKVLFVVYTDRGDASRLISARLATPRERRVYDGDETDLD